jgi:hypothetical protein
MRLAKATDVSDQTIARARKSGSTFVEPEKRLGLDGKKQAGPNVPTKLWRLQGKPGIDRAALSRASGSPRSLMGSNSSTNFPIVNEERFQTPQAECRKPARCSCKDEDDRRIVAVAICSNVGHH